LFYILKEKTKMKQSAYIPIEPDFFDLFRKEMKKDSEKNVK